MTVKFTIPSFKQLLIGILLPLLFGNHSLFAQSETLVTTVEAESGVRSGGVTISSSNPGYSGTGYVTNFTNSADKIMVTVNVPATAFYKIVVRYNGPNGNKYQNLSVNSGAASSVQFPASSGYTTVNAGKYVLNSGSNTITIQNSWGWTDIDNFMIYTTIPNSYNNVVPDLVDTSANPATKSLYGFLLSQYTKRIISGQTDGSYYDSIVKVSGKSPMYRTWDFNRYTAGYPYLWANGGFTFGVDPTANSTESAIAWYNSTGKKGIVGFHWHWCSPSGGKVGTNTFSTANTTFDITKAVQPGTAEYTLILRDIDVIAVQLKRLQTAGVPLLWRPLHEAGGGWFWWGAKGPAACVQLYNIMFDRLTNYHQIHNLIWVWSTPETAWYPGNNKVDIIGYDSYPANFNYGSQKNSFDILYNLVSGAKIVTMSENGPIPNPDDCLNLDAPWSFFMSWNDLVLSGNSKAHITDVFTNSRVLTLENDTFPLIINVTNGLSCGTGSVTLGATANFGTVNWYAAPTGGDTIHSGTTFITPSLSVTTKYYIEASYNKKPSEAKRIPVVATVSSLPSAAGIITGSSSVCIGATGVVYRVPSITGASSYIWTLPTGITGVSTADTISVSIGNTAVAGNIKVKGHSGCGDGTERTFAIVVNPTPITPIITFTNGILQSNASSGNQWYFGGNIIQNATNDSLIPPQNGNYYLIITANGCSSQPSNAITVNSAGVNEVLNNSRISIYPNPTSGVIKISINHEFDSDYIVEVYNNVGGLLQTLKKGKLESTFDMDFGKFPAGIYMLRIYNSSKYYQKKIIKTS